MREKGVEKVLGLASRVAGSRSRERGKIDDNDDDDPENEDGEKGRSKLVDFLHFYKNLLSIENEAH